MGEITPNFAQKIVEAGRDGTHSPLTPWEESQLAYGWLQARLLPELVRALSGIVERGTDSPEHLAAEAAIAKASAEFPHLTQPAQAVDVGAIREVIAWLRRQEGIRVDPDHVAESLTAALPKDSNGAEWV